MVGRFNFVTLAQDLLTEPAMEVTTITSIALCLVVSSFFLNFLFINSFTMLTIFAPYARKNGKFIPLVRPSPIENSGLGEKYIPLAFLKPQY